MSKMMTNTEYRAKDINNKKKYDIIVRKIFLITKYSNKSLEFKWNWGAVKL